MLEMHIIIPKARYSRPRRMKRSFYIMLGRLRGRDYLVEADDVKPREKPAPHRMDGAEETEQEKGVQERVMPQSEAAGGDGHTPKGKVSFSSVLMYCISALLMLYGLWLLVRQFVIFDSGYQPPPIIITPMPTIADNGGDPTGEPVPTEYVKVAPTKIYFVERAISCVIQPVGLTPSRAMDTVDDPHIAAWYKDGPSPGEEGNALINGHVRWKGVVGYFSVLPEMDIGEKIVIEYENGWHNAFYVTEVLFYPFDEVPSEIMSLDGETRVTLISCYGRWNQEYGTSEQRVFVICKPDKPEV